MFWYNIQRVLNQRTCAFVFLAVCILFKTCHGSAYGTICPWKCKCEDYKTNCFQVGKKTVPDIVDIDYRTVTMDLRYNQIRRIPRDAFNGLRNLTSILLDSNQIQELEHHAFRGLDNIRILSLKNNRLSILHENAFDGISGNPATCSSTGSCMIDLSSNDIRVIEKNAFAWIKRMGIILGRVEYNMLVKPYAFYGVRNIPKIEITDVPTLTLEPHAFTNTENIGALKIAHTHIANVRPFTFEGLKNVKYIEIKDSEMDKIEHYGFGGIEYQVTQPQKGTQTANVSYSHGGGVVNITSCVITNMAGDLFRDTNIAHIAIQGSTLHRLQPNVFRGMAHLRKLHFTANTLETLPSKSLAHLKNVDEVIFDHNDLSFIDEYCFKGSHGLKQLTFRLKPHSNLTLESQAFSGIMSLERFQIIGNPHQGSSTMLIRPNAFQTMVVGDFNVMNITLPTLTKHSFRGLSKVNYLSFVSCNISEVAPSTFGNTGESYGSVVEMDMAHGNNLTCNCNTSKLMFEFQDMFPKFHMHCIHDANTEPQHVAADSMTLTLCSAASSVTGTYLVYFLLFVTFLFTLQTV